MYWVGTISLLLVGCHCGVEPDVPGETGSEETGSPDTGPVDTGEPPQMSFTPLEGTVLEGRVGGHAGVGLSAGDLDGDGIAELLVAEHNDAATCAEGESCASAWLLSVPTEGGVLSDLAFASFSASAEALSSGEYQLERDMAFPGDLNGDGTADILLLADREPDSVPAYDPEGWGFLLWSGPFEGEITRGQAVASLDPLADAVDHSPCDLNADGQADLCTSGGLVLGPMVGVVGEEQLLCDLYNEVHLAPEQRVSRFVEAGELLTRGGQGMASSFEWSGWETKTDGELQVRGGAEDACDLDYWVPYPGDEHYGVDHGWLQRSVVVDGDIGGDESDEILMVSRRAGKRHIAILTEPNVQLMSPSRIEIQGTLASGERDSALLADFDGDGQDDLAWSSSRGWVSILRGPLSDGDHRETDAAVALIGPHEPASDGEGYAVPDDFGASMAAGDFDGDGRADLAIGAPGDDDTAGRVYIAWGGGL
jgi:hypothetical protein